MLHIEVRGLVHLVRVAPSVVSDSSHLTHRSLWIEQLIRQKFTEATRELKDDLKRREDLLVSGAALDTEGLQEDVQTLFRYTEAGAVEVPRGIRKFCRTLLKAWRKRARKTRWKRKIFRTGQGT